jgi:hypothetical protein
MSLSLGVKRKEKHDNIFARIRQNILSQIFLANNENFSEINVTRKINWVIVLSRFNALNFRSDRWCTKNNRRNTFSQQMFHMRIQQKFKENKSFVSDATWSAWSWTWSSPTATPSRRPFPSLLLELTELFFLQCKKSSDFPVSCQDVTYQTLSRQEQLNYSQPGRFWLVIFRHGNRKFADLFYSVNAGWSNRAHSQFSS